MLSEAERTRPALDGQVSGVSGRNTFGDSGYVFVRDPRLDVLCKTMRSQSRYEACSEN
jgi:hypothetical protein